MSQNFHFVASWEMFAEAMSPQAVSTRTSPVCTRVAFMGFPNE